MTDITTVAEFRAAVTAAKDVLAQVRFGCSERWVRVSKADARALVSGYGRNDTPEQHEMDAFATVEGTTLYLG
jgi:hypothetical protein